LVRTKTVVLDFEDLTKGTRLTNQYNADGLTFSSPQNLLINTSVESSIPTSGSLAVTVASSGSSNAQCEIRFNPAIAAFGAFFIDNSAMLRMELFNSAGNKIGDNYYIPAASAAKDSGHYYGIREAQNRNLIARISITNLRKFDSFGMDAVSFGRNAPSNLNLLTFESELDFITKAKSLGVNFFNSDFFFDFEAGTLKDSINAETKLTDQYLSNWALSFTGPAPLIVSAGDIYGSSPASGNQGVRVERRYGQDSFEIDFRLPRSALGFYHIDNSAPLYVRLYAENGDLIGTLLTSKTTEDGNSARFFGFIVNEFPADAMFKVNVTIMKDLELFGFDRMWIGTTQPLYVELSQFNATSQSAGVELYWRTEAELDNLGFYLYRSSSAEGPWQLMNQNLIPAEGNPYDATDYYFFDSNVAPGQAYYYRLESQDIYGQTQSHGPISCLFE
jgi:hypothetical protein